MKLDLLFRYCAFDNTWKSILLFDKNRSIEEELKEKVSGLIQIYYKN